MVAGDVFATPESWLRQKPGVKWRRMEPDVLAAWVADMDFPTPEPVQRALQRVLDDGDLGYADWRDGTPCARCSRSACHAGSAGMSIQALCGRLPTLCRG
jgi:bifunctional pyridoxal-dependent enzyme with beta-cystathionase and maltose regulon repressor activities